MQEHHPVQRHAWHRIPFLCVVQGHLTITQHSYEQPRTATCKPLASQGKALAYDFAALLHSVSVGLFLASTPYGVLRSLSLTREPGCQGCRRDALVCYSVLVIGMCFQYISGAMICEHRIIIKIINIDIPGQDRARIVRQYKAGRLTLSVISPVPDV